jgi:hypothetical protein
MLVNLKPEKYFFNLSEELKKRKIMLTI